MHHVLVDGVKVGHRPDLQLCAVLERNNDIGGAADAAHVLDAADVAVDDLGVVLAAKAAADGDAAAGELVAHPGGAGHGGYERDDADDGENGQRGHDELVARRRRVEERGLRLQLALAGRQLVGRPVPTRLAAAAARRRRARARAAARARRGARARARQKGGCGGDEGHLGGGGFRGCDGGLLVDKPDERGRRGRSAERVISAKKASHTQLAVLSLPPSLASLSGPFLTCVVAC